MHATVDDANFCDGPCMHICKVKVPCINSMCISLLIHGLVLVKTELITVHSKALF